MPSFLKKIIGSVYRGWLRPRFSLIQQQRFKLLWTIWGYWPILLIKPIGLKDRIRLILRSMRVDWYVQHAHWPGEIARVVAAIGERKARLGEVVVEAGCWQGGSTIKLSIICDMLGYRLVVFDSFQGVEHVPGDPFSGKYSAALDLVKKNVAMYGQIDVCEFVPGWFSETLAGNTFQHPTQVLYLDCDLAKGTQEVLQGVLPFFVDGGAITSQDYPIKAIKALLDNKDTWRSLGVPTPVLVDRFRQLAIFRFKKHTVPVTAVLALSPLLPTVAVGGQKGFSGSGGVAPYSYSIEADTTGGASIDRTTGLYTAGPTLGSSTVRVTDATLVTVETIVG
jgi:O-methyltransferase